MFALMPRISLVVGIVVGKWFSHLDSCCAALLPTDEERFDALMQKQRVVPFIACMRQK
jgi:hypothetical protein